MKMSPSLKHACLAVALAIFLILVGTYINDARHRRTARECITARSHNDQYRAVSCVTGGDGNLYSYVGRLYTAKSGNLIGETHFDSMDGGAPKFMPDDSAVLFEGAEDTDSGGIDIPPSFLERLRAHLP